MSRCQIHRCKTEGDFEADHRDHTDKFWVCTHHAVEAFRAGAKVTGDGGQVFDWTEEHEPIYSEPSATEEKRADNYPESP